ncbi:hypothetical protein EDD17DRAFT_432839 [Pisolithus thermaeus]|nr:hypothetical protein EDD17DRAFT_432839 [Pisolithus thermaeus]
MTHTGRTLPFSAVFGLVLDALIYMPLRCLYEISLSFPPFLTFSPCIILPCIRVITHADPRSFACRSECSHHQLKRIERDRGPLRASACADHSINARSIASRSLTMGSGACICAWDWDWELATVTFTFTS